MVDLEGNVVHGEHKPSTDTPTHLALYKAFEDIGGVVHTHSTWATVWAQAQREIPLLGTTHADLSAHPIPLARALSATEVEDDYEGATGSILIEAISDRTPEEVPCVLVRGHGPFCWGPDPAKAVQNAVTLEEVARMALFARLLDRRCADARCRSARQALPAQAWPPGLLRPALELRARPARRCPQPR